MNAAQQDNESEQIGESSGWLSALADGEATMAELDALFGSGSDQVELNKRWHSYHLTGEALRGEVPCASSRSPQAFLSGVMAGLPASGQARLKLDTLPTVAHVRAPAANDPLVRWKLLAGAASVAAVVAVSWSVLRLTPGAVDSGSPAGAQLAVVKPVGGAPVALSEPLVVKTEQGTLVRDARLEQLLAEHRQFGGASALQMPAGFLRNATYQNAPQR
jgi:sigma-E factor negative regulatory protein RseA